MVKLFSNTYGVFPVQQINRKVKVQEAEVFEFRTVPGDLKYLYQQICRKKMLNYEPEAPIAINLENSEEPIVWILSVNGSPARTYGRRNFLDLLTNNPEENWFVWGYTKLKGFYRAQHVRSYFFGRSILTKFRFRSPFYGHFWQGKKSPFAAKNPRMLRAFYRLRLLIRTRKLLTSLLIYFEEVNQKLMWKSPYKNGRDPANSLLIGWLLVQDAKLHRMQTIYENHGDGLVSNLGSTDWMEKNNEEQFMTLVPLSLAELNSIANSSYKSVQSTNEEPNYEESPAIYPSDKEWLSNEGYTLDFLKYKNFRLGDFESFKKRLTLYGAPANRTLYSSFRSWPHIMCEASQDLLEYHIRRTEGIRNPRTRAKKILLYVQRDAKQIRNRAILIQNDLDTLAKSSQDSVAHSTTEAARRAINLLYKRTIFEAEKFIWKELLVHPIENQVSNETDLDKTELLSIDSSTKKDDNGTTKAVEENYNSIIIDLEEATVKINALNNQSNENLSEVDSEEKYENEETEYCLPVFCPPLSRYCSSRHERKKIPKQMYTKKGFECLPAAYKTVKLPRYQSNPRDRRNPIFRITPMRRRRWQDYDYNHQPIEYSFGLDYKKPTGNTMK
uniref:hypothetical protein n=1 Tax=Haramonas pauciplastida TaxID=478668 RepID=UPI002113F21B|nr:hypothetical protein NQY21_pgp066 [Haramonas pauciplastida]YP_010444194.1 hypothetical protein NQY21_pgp004 [Haramonas pauciplastida]UTE95018.1 hypothetical protein HaraPt_p109 [Haramonas pauciplastida]UTE95080.1 hypothetical protein HaraPt_p171 [Haramonas pauciplastida]